MPSSFSVRCEFNSFCMKTDIIIIGAGPGGYECAVRAAKEGFQVVVVEAKAVGGTCLNEGCIPTKCFCRHAEVLEDVRNAARYGITAGEPELDMRKVVARKNEVVGRLAEGVRSLLGMPGITLVEGKARLVDAHTVAVGDDEYSAEHIVIATGSVTRMLPIPGADSKGVVTSAEMLDLEEVPRRLCVIGGGVIGLEFASIFRTFGSEVTVVEFCKEILPNFDKDVAKRLRTALKKRGISFKTGAAVTSVEEGADGSYAVCYEEKGKPGRTEADVVLMAVGRSANIASLNLDGVGVAYTQKGIVVDDNMCTNIPGIYAIGDVNGRLQLAHAATYQGFRVLNHIQGRTDDIRFDAVPAAVFTVPEVASVGLTEEACVEKGISYDVHKSFYRANGKALAMDADEGIVKLLTDADGHLLGAHILGAHAADLVHEAALLMKLGGTVDQLADAVHAHPTLSELLPSAIRE